jgi:hypothetical protein
MKDNIPQDDAARNSLKASCELAPDWHPLAAIDQFILACGWTHDGKGFVPPLDWQEAIAIRHGGGIGKDASHWKREHAVQFCVRYHEQEGRLRLV